MDTEIFKPEELAEARGEALDETVKELHVWSRRAKDPAKRVALAELEKLLMTTRKSWQDQGLIALEGATAA